MAVSSNNFDKIHIRDILLRCIIGINPDEREKKQDIVINVTLYANLTKACQSDNIKDTVDYKKVKNEIVQTVEDSSFCLIEKMAEEIANICFKEPLVLKVKVSVDKPGALRFAKSVAC
jgi:D-erythro-7,8-dihydroneopterin triphosphate epimerase